MRIRQLVGALTFAGVLLSMQASAQFEGVVETWNKTTTDESGGAFEYMTRMTIKGALVRIHTTASGDAPASTMIYRTDRGLFWILNEAEQSYFEVRTLGGHGGDLLDSLPPSEREEFRATGESRTILGYRAEQYVAENRERRIEIWGTTGLQGLATALRTVFESAGGEEESVWNDELTARGVFPLISRISINGRVVESSEVRRIDRRRVSDETFALPAGYRKVSIDELFEEQGPDG